MISAFVNSLPWLGAPLQELQFISSKTVAQPFQASFVAREDSREEGAISEGSEDARINGLIDAVWLRDR